jgi:menaquinone-specific isochorismate synthase
MLNSVTLNPCTTISDHHFRPATPTTLTSYSVPWPELSLLDFLRHGADAPRLLWDTPQSPLQFAGFGLAARLTATDHRRFATIQRQADDLFARITLLNPEIPDSVGPRLFGGFSFKVESPPAGLWSAFAPAVFVLPQVQLTHVEGQAWLTLNRHFEPDTSPADMRRALQREIDHLRRTLTPVDNRATQPQAYPPPAVTEVMSHDTWRKLVTEATRRIRRGELDKVVLARARHMRFARPIDPTAVLARLAERYPDTYRFLFEPIPGHAFYGATPELLAHVEGDTLRTVAMAGSIRRGETPAADIELGRQLLANPKERHEHQLVVDAIRENLGSLVENLDIPQTPAICTLSNIQHLETRIQGNITTHDGILQVTEALHPTPAVGGRPRKIALEIINQVEPTPRGWYAAPIGWLDHRGNGMFAVAIRSAVSVGGESMLFAGAGLVADSEPEKEWRETELKFRPLAEALRGEPHHGRAKS